MPETRMSLPSESSTRLRDLGERSVTSIIFDSALEAAWRAFVLMILGNVAVSLVGGIFHDMIPSLPPGFGGAEASSHSQRHWHWSSQWLHRGAFFPIFVLLFAGIVWVRLWPASVDSDGKASSRRSRRRWQRIQRVLRDEWFGLFAGNAFSAMIAAMIAIWLQRFSVVQWLLAQVFALIVPPLHQLFGSLFGDGAAGRMDAWFSWYGQNQAKFTFWLIYFATICDDLGLPNIKTLGRWLWKRMKARMAERDPKSGTPAAS